MTFSEHPGAEHPGEAELDDEHPGGEHPGEAELDETFEAVLFDWDGTAVVDRAADASGLQARVEALSAAGVHVFVVSGTHVGNVDGQLQARPHGPGRLFFCANRGSEVFRATPRGLRLVSRRVATPEEDAALDRAAALVVRELSARGLGTEVVSSRLNRRKIDLIPEPEWADPKKAEIAALLTAVERRLAMTDAGTLADVVELARRTARSAGLEDPRITSDVKHVEIGLTDKSDSARFAARWLEDEGLTGRLVLVAGDELGPIGGVPGSDSLMLVEQLARAVVVSVGVEPGGVPPGVAALGGGPRRFLELLDAQLARRAARRVPRVDDDPRWVVPLPVHPSSERVAEALGALSNGRAGTRGSREDRGAGSSPLFCVAGLYDDEDRLVHGPVWTDLQLSAPPADGKGGSTVVDLRTGVLFRADEGRSLRTLRVVFAQRPYFMGMRAEAGDRTLSRGNAPLTVEGSCARAMRRGRTAVASTGSKEVRLAVAASDRWVDRSGCTILERVCAWSAGKKASPTERRAARRLAQADAVGFEALLAGHRRTWARRWRDAGVTITGGADAARDELAARFAVFHLLSSASARGEAPVGARGMTGEAYEGHVFWDADSFVLPALVALSPRAARAMLEYRIRRLPAARAHAAELGLAGARFPWESARDGSDVTPTLVFGAHGEPVEILTGTHEEHIVADVAWAAVRYAQWSGDPAFLDSPGRDLVVETARYWASRIRLDHSGHGHLDGVMGPDEYHQVVDDNAYTNAMARWNLRRGADLLSEAGSGVGNAKSANGARAEEAASWRDLAARLVDGFDAERGIYEQFAGYFALEPLMVADFARPPVAIDVLLGAERVAKSQLIKQADALMIHHMLPEDAVPGSLEPCIDFYEPRTAHGSSLSPAISATLLARAGRPDDALELFRVAARIDLDDITGTTAGGLHLAAMGGVWQALAFGFLGARVEAGGLVVDPRLPSAWQQLSLRFRVRGVPVGLTASHDEVAVECAAPLRIRVAGTEAERGSQGRVVVPVRQETSGRGATDAERSSS
ncbi:MAG: hypothetical protein M0Z46_20420 [Actinomycetota bacterium]|nr:hypothetical protein [Actinomycetota bacterium]